MSRALSVPALRLTPTITHHTPTEAPAMSRTPLDELEECIEQVEELADSHTESDHPIRQALGTALSEVAGALRSALTCFRDFGGPGTSSARSSGPRATQGLFTPGEGPHTVKVRMPLSKAPKDGKWWRGNGKGRTLVCPSKKCKRLVRKITVHVPVNGAWCGCGAGMVLLTGEEP